MNVSHNAPKLLTYNNTAGSAKAEKTETPQENQGIVYDSTAWTGDTEGHYLNKTADALRDFAAKNSCKSEQSSGMSRMDKIKTGAIAGATLGFVGPALTIIGLAATPLTVPMGAVMGAFAGAIAE